MGPGSWVTRLCSVLSSATQQAHDVHGISQQVLYDILSQYLAGMSQRTYGRDTIHRWANRTLPAGILYRTQCICTISRWLEDTISRWCDPPVFCTNW